MKIRVYRNIHKQTFSVLSRRKKHWLLLMHSDNLFLRDAVFRVSQKGRERVLKQHRKNVHAFIEGTLCERGDSTACKVVTYNPYKNSQFVCEGKEITNAPFVHLVDNKVLVGRFA